MPSIPYSLTKLICEKYLKTTTSSADICQKLPERIHGSTKIKAELVRTFKFLNL